MTADQASDLVIVDDFVTFTGTFESDFFFYLALFAAMDERADIDGDGDIDAEDFFAFLDLFAGGCG